MGDLVQLYIYDLSGGMARSLSQMLLGRQIEAIYHTSIVVGGMEHYFGGGINVARAGSTPFGQPMEVLDLGRTEITEELRAELLAELSERFTPEAYSLFHNNCNNFSHELAQLLCGRGIPEHITGLPAEVLSTPFGQMIKPMLANLEQQLRGMQQQAFRPHAAELAAAAAPPSGSASSDAASRQPAAEGPIMRAAEVEIDAAIAGGMMQEAQHEQQQAAGPHPGAAPGAAAGPDQAAKLAVHAAKLAVELAVQAEYERLMATGEVEEHEAQALALEAVAVQQSLLEQQPQQAE